MLCGKKIILKPLEWDDLDLVHQWYLDPDVRYWGSGNHPDSLYSKYELEEMYEREIRNDSARRFMIETQDGEKIGVITYRNMNKQLHKATIGISLGDKDYWGHGFGTDAVRTLLKFLFEECNLNRVELETFEGNERAVRVYEKCGFVVEGRIRDGFYVSGQYRVKIIMGILKRDYDQIKDSW